MGLYKHNLKFHSNKNIFNCTYCNKQFNHKQNKWRHEQKCNLKNNKNLKKI